MTLRLACERFAIRRSPSLVVLIFALLLLVTPGARAAPAQQEVGPTAGGRKIYLPLASRSAPATGQPPSAELIDAAVARGELSAETGLVYKVYATFADPRLPAQYRGNDSNVTEAPWLRHAAARWPAFSPQTRAILAPFIQPPLYTNSWAGQGASVTATPGEVPEPLPDGNWQNVTAVGGKVRVWWNTETGSSQAAAQKIAGIMTNRVYPMLTNYLGRIPVDDTGPHVFTDLNGNEQVWGDGEDGAMDIYTVGDIRGMGGAFTVAYPPGCQTRPAFMIVEAEHKNLEAALSHEFMHVLQFAYKPQGDCKAYEWLTEGTAHWALDFVYSSNNYEHDSPLLQRAPNMALDRGYGYDSWPFFWQLDRTLGLPQAVRAIWEKTEQQPTGLAAVNAAIPGGLATQWHKVALHNLNRLTYNELSRLDQFSEQARLTQDMDLPLNAAPHKTYQLSVELDSPAAQYYHFTTDDETISTLAFVNPYTADKYPHVHAQALIHIQGRASWEPVEDWTGRSRSFCRDLKAERIDELYIIISNDRWQDPRPTIQTPAPTIELTNIACRGWKGEVTYKSWYIDEIEPGVVLSEINQDFWTGVTFYHEPTPPWLSGPAHSYRVEPGTVVSVNDWGWSLSADEPPIKCHYLVDDVGPVQTEQSNLLIYADKSRAYGAWGAMPVFDLQGTDSCEGTVTVHYDRPDWWLTSDEDSSPEWKVSQDGVHLSGKWERYRTPTAWATYEWSFTALPPE